MGLKAIWAPDFSASVVGLGRHGAMAVVASVVVAITVAVAVVVALRNVS